MVFEVGCIHLEEPDNPWSMQTEYYIHLNYIYVSSKNKKCI